MTPRATLPGAAELFRTTSPMSPARPGEAPASEPPTADAAEGGPGTSSGAGPAQPRTVRPTSRRRSPAGPRGDRSSSGRERHEEKITVYVSAAELVDLEHARLTLRAEHGIAVDRGRIVREALSVLLADLESKQDDSILVRRLADS